MLSLQSSVAQLVARSAVTTIPHAYRKQPEGFWFDPRRRRIVSFCVFRPLPLGYLLPGGVLSFSMFDFSLFLSWLFLNPFLRQARVWCGVVPRLDEPGN
jgi:hypothetical protein